MALGKKCGKTRLGKRLRWSKFTPDPSSSNVSDLMVCNRDLTCMRNWKKGNWAKSKGGIRLLLFQQISLQGGMIFSHLSFKLKAWGWSLFSLSSTFATTFLFCFLKCLVLVFYSLSSHSFESHALLKKFIFQLSFFKIHSCLSSIFWK